ncbi:glutathione S-transferase family protein [Thaumasiovibrio subtropicus]|uniref:glutathione S-transferase family protein n=1 Tax=Thaumasiovibrio subtropicus TaxID=1891207 RepID=UPI000B35130D|nr:glutathione S-transferase family protein [Thaumasiovibrio subtropicus]
MKIYEKSPAPSAQRVSLFLKEKGIDVERIDVDIRGGENLKPEFKALSPNGRIPVLVLEDGTSICESMAICRYFEASHPDEKHLFGNTPTEQAQVEMWNRICEFQGLYTAFQAFRNLTGIYKDRETCIEAWGVESKNRIKQFLPQLDERLASTTYVAGERFSVADITAYITCQFIKNLEIDASTYSHIERWLDLVSARPAFQ